jgi:vacuolar-type H+-ATPase subunit C/Vma6
MAYQRKWGRNPRRVSHFFYETLTSTSREIYAEMPDDFVDFYARTYSYKNVKMSEMLFRLF